MRCGSWLYCKPEDKREYVKHVFCAAQIVTLAAKREAEREMARVAIRKRIDYSFSVISKII